MNKIDIAFKNPGEVNPFFKHYDTVEDWWNVVKTTDEKPEQTRTTFHQLDIFSLLEQEVAFKKDLNKF